MSQLMKYVAAYSHKSYMFTVALDRIPEPEEKAEMKNNIRDAMEALGVPAGQVAVQVFKSDIPPQIGAEDEGQKIDRTTGYLLCSLIRSEPGVLQQDPDEISREAVEAFAIYSGIDKDRITSVVLENAYLEVKTEESPWLFFTVGGDNYDDDDY